MDLMYVYKEQSGNSLFAGIKVRDTLATRWHFFKDFMDKDDEINNDVWDFYMKAAPYPENNVRFYVQEFPTKNLIAIYNKFQALVKELEKLKEKKMLNDLFNKAYSNHKELDKLTTQGGKLLKLAINNYRKEIKMAQVKKTKTKRSGNGSKLK